MSVKVAGEEFNLFPERAVFWPAQKILLLADLHLGKVNHFRKAGIPVPSRANDRNIELLLDLVTITRPERVICLGDLFHSHYNPEWEVFGEVVRHFKGILFELVLGNHDVMSLLQYKRKDIRVHPHLTVGPFMLTHHPVENILDGCYNLAGHVHPGVLLQGKGKQAETLPCFYFGERQGFLPAFGAFTGLSCIHPQKDDQIYVIAGSSVFPVT